MFKRIIFISLIVLFATTGEIFADAAAQLEQAMNYVDGGQFEQARTIYNSLLGNQPDKETDILARSGLIVIDILQGNTTVAKTSADQLIANNSSDEIVSSAAFDTAYAFLYEAVQPNEARQYYQYIVDNWPNSGDAISAKFGVIMCNNSLGKVQEADTALNKLLSNLPTEEDLSGQLLDIAEYYQSVGKYDSARQLYQLVIDTWPDSEVAIFAYRGVGFCQAVDGNDTGAMNVLNIVLEKFAGHPDLSEEALAIAEPFYDEAFRLLGQDNEAQAQVYFQSAIEIAELVKRKAGVEAVEADTCLWLGACYEQTGQYQKAVDCFQTMADTYPEHKLASHALIMTARGYERLYETGVLSESQANAQIKAVYERLVEEYPDDNTANIAENWLNSNDSN